MWQDASGSVWFSLAGNWLTNNTECLPLGYQSSRRWCLRSKICRYVQKTDTSGRDLATQFKHKSIAKAAGNLVKKCVSYLPTSSLYSSVLSKSCTSGPGLKAESQSVSQSTDSDGLLSSGYRQNSTAALWRVRVRLWMSYGTAVIKLFNLAVTKTNRLISTLPCSQVSHSEGSFPQLGWERISSCSGERCLIYWWWIMNSALTLLLRWITVAHWGQFNLHVPVCTWGRKEHAVIIFEF